MFVQIEGFPHYFIDESGTVASVKGAEWKELKPGLSKRGYLLVCLYDANGKRITKNVHVLVAAAFLGPKPEGYEIDHIDPKLGKTNNHYTNLEYVCHLENMHRAWGNGLRKITTNHKTGETRKTMIPDDQILQILRLKGSGRSQRSIANEFGISQSLVSKLWQGKAKKYLLREGE